MYFPAAALALLLLVSTSTSRPLLPDLVVTRIDVRDRARLDLITPSAGNPITIYVDIQNRSSETAADVALVCRRSQFTNGTPLAEATVRTGALAPNTTKSLKLPISGESSAGPGSMKCTVDDGSTVAESNENNNSLTFDFVHTVQVSTEFRVELRNFRPWPERSLHRSVYFEVYNSGGRGPAPPPPGAQHRVRWQADCQLPQMPWTLLRAQGNMNNYAGGDVPPPGGTGSAAFWLFPADPAGKPPISAMPATLTLTCNITVGAFLPNVPIMHSGDPTPHNDWGMPIVWWKGGTVLTIPNPEAATYTPPQDVSVASVSMSASPTSDVPLQTTQNAFARFSVRLNDAVPSLEVRCSASSGVNTQTRNVSFTNTGTTVNGSADFGMLTAGVYNVLCEADPNKRIQDANPVNNSLTRRDTVFAPTLDVLIQKVEVRDRPRLALITPTAGHEITAYVDIHNRSAQNAPDMALVCRHASSAGAPALAAASVRTGLIGPNAMKTMTVAIPATASAGPGNMSCVVDDGNVVQESDESNNTKALDFVNEADRSTDFSIEIRNIRPWPERELHRTIRFDVVNTSTRGPAAPPSGTPLRLRWQAVCSIVQMPWVTLREVGNMNHYAGGDVPQPGTTQSSGLWGLGFNQYNMPQVSSMPATLNLACTITVGAFTPNFPVMHAGDPSPQTDWGAPMVWWKQSVVLSLPNPEKR